MISFIPHIILAIVLIVFLCVITITSSLISYCVFGYITSCWPEFKNTKVHRSIYNFYMLLYLISAKFYALCTNGIVVDLLDYNGSGYITVAWKTSNSDLDAYTFFMPKIGQLNLKPDGSVWRTNGNSNYIHHWLPHNMCDRVAFILQKDVKSFNIFR